MKITVTHMTAMEVVMGVVRRGEVAVEETGEAVEEEDAIAIISTGELEWIGVTH